MPTESAPVLSAPVRSRPRPMSAVSTSSRHRTRVRWTPRRAWPSTALPAAPGFGRLFLVYTEETVDESNDMDIMVRYSDDIGTTWSARSGSTTTPRPTASSCPRSLPIRPPAMWRCAGMTPATRPATIRWRFICSTATPTAGTPVFAANVKVSDGISTSNGPGVEYGDYMGLTFNAGIVTPVWADTSNSTGDNPNGTSNFDAYVDQLLPPGQYLQGRLRHHGRCALGHCVSDSCQ